MSGVGRTDHNATDPEWKVPSASKYRDTAYLFGVQGTSVFVHLFYKGKVTLARLLQTAVNTDHVKETSLIPCAYDDIFLTTNTGAKTKKADKRIHCNLFQTFG